MQAAAIFLGSGREGSMHFGDLATAFLQIFFVPVIVMGLKLFKGNRVEQRYGGRHIVSCKHI